jgi:hypothetical protein
MCCTWIQAGPVHLGKRTSISAGYKYNLCDWLVIEKLQVQTMLLWGAPCVSS